MTTTNPDVVIVGAGHNALVTAAYLAKAGRKVLVLEARAVAGGQLSGATPDAPGLYAAGHLRPDIVRDLGLAQHGLARSRPRDALPIELKFGHCATFRRNAAPRV